MKIVIATPLYPPDIAEPAPYVKELAKRLAAEHVVTILAYGQLPEQIAGVHIVAISKRQPAGIRVFRYAIALWRVARNADVVYAQNGASVELPAGIVALLTRVPLVLHFADTAAHERAQQSVALRAIERFARAHASAIVSGMPLPRPEILPFAPFPTAAFDAYEKSWEAHLAVLAKEFEHAKQ